ncbi:MAG: hypothetical protein ACK5LN_08570 [Propioniciclava sp.]
MSSRQPAGSVGCWSTLLVASIAVTASAPAAAEPSPCPGVWVVVGHERARCAAEYDTGKVALTSAGFAVVEAQPGLLCRIDERPATCRLTADAYWSYWHTSQNADGSWQPWEYSSVGYTTSRPPAGSADGWTFGDGSEPPPAMTAALAEQTPAITPSPPGANAEPTGARPDANLAPTLATGAILVVGGGALLWWLRRRRR